MLGRPLEPSEREKALEIVRANGGVPSAVTTAREWAAKAVETCVDLPDTPELEERFGPEGQRLTVSAGVGRSAYSVTDATQPAATGSSGAVADRQLNVGSRTWATPCSAFHVPSSTG